MTRMVLPGRSHGKKRCIIVMSRAKIFNRPAGTPRPTGIIKFPPARMLSQSCMAIRKKEAKYARNIINVNWKTPYKVGTKCKRGAIRVSSRLEIMVAAKNNKLLKPISKAAKTNLMSRIAVRGTGILKICFQAFEACSLLSSRATCRTIAMTPTNISHVCPPSEM